MFLPSAARSVVLVTLLAAGLLSGCDLLGIETASVVAARKEAEGRAVGAGCRHAGRTIEDCYENNRRADKAAVFAGWREMNDYMRENEMESPPLTPPEPATSPASPAAPASAAAAAPGAAPRPASREGARN